MEEKDKNREKDTRDPRESMEINQLRADEKIQRNRSTRKINRLWMWLGIIILLFILFWWLFSIGAFEALQ